MTADTSAPTGGASVLSVLALLSAAAVLAFTACDPQAKRGAEPSAAAIQDHPDPSLGSYRGDFAEAVLSNVDVRRPKHPFPRAFDVGDSRFSLVFYTEDGSVEDPLVGASGDKADGADAVRVDLDSWSPEAWYGTVRYRVSGTDSLVAERMGTEALESLLRRDEPIASGKGLTMPPERAAAKGSPADALAKAKAAPRAGSIGPESLWRYDAGTAITAGPIVFEKLVLVGTSKPSWLCLERASGALVFEKPADRLFRGPLAYLKESASLVAFAADGRICIFSASAPAPAAAERGEDAVEKLLTPEPEALKRIEASLAKSRSDEAALPALAAHPFGVRGLAAGEAAAVFRLDPDATGNARIYADGEQGKTVRLELFDASGASLATGASAKPLAHVLQKGKVYWVLASRLEGLSSGPVRLRLAATGRK